MKTDSKLAKLRSFSKSIAGDPSVAKEVLINIVGNCLGLREPWMREIFNKVKHGDKKRAKVAIVALARKLLVICWAMLKNGTTFDADYAKRFVKC